MLYIASDHGGFKLKEHLKKFLAKEKIAFKDLGPKKFVAGDDYPDYAKLVGQKVSKSPISDTGILICRSGQGVCVVANKFKNVRAALVWNTVEAKISRNDDMSNVLCLPSDYISPRVAEHIVDTWLQTPYSSDPRHIRRVKKIQILEK
jgi:RpiB/LacA/LacB family sugar-phosphate isomerase